MSSSAKLVIGWLVIVLVLNFAGFLLLHPVRQAGSIVNIVVQVALLTGLSARQPAAWYAARWLAGLGVVFSLLGTVFVILAPNRTAVMMITVATTLVVELGFFYLLGRPDAKAYFTRRPGPNKSLEPTADRP